MITGFNTDVKCGDRVFHVQTEDKGAANPLIESLIYVKGAILDAHRTNYKSFLQSETFSESILQRILEFQHRQIVSSIKKGKFQKGMPLEAYVEGPFIFELADVTNNLVNKASGSLPPDALLTAEPAPESPETISPPSSISQPPSLQREVLPTPPVSVHPLLARPTRIDLAIDSSAASDLLTEQGIEICVEGSKEFVGGSHVDLSLSVLSRQGRLRLENVQVIIKIIGTTFSPRLYAGKTDKSGVLHMNFNLPSYSAGSAALIIQASTALGNDEIKYLIRRR
jgi:hypothetical protein